TVSVVGDTAVESSETFTVNLSNASSNATIVTAQGTGTIVNDDGITPSLSTNSASQNEGTSGTSSFVFTVSLSVAATQPVTVAYSTADGTATVSNSDYGAQSGTLPSFPTRRSSDLTVSVVGDTAVESSETFTVNLSNASSNATIGTAQGTGTIVND